MAVLVAVAAWPAAATARAEPPAVEHQPGPCTVPDKALSHGERIPAGTVTAHHEVRQRAAFRFNDVDVARDTVPRSAGKCDLAARVRPHGSGVL